MHHLVYLSSSAYTFSEADLRHILTTSRKNNIQRNITGILLYHDGSILQVLEGEKLEIYELYLKIMKDERHGGIVKLIDEEIDARDFADWSMGFRNLSSKEWENLSGFVNLHDKKHFMQELASKSLEVLTMIKTFMIVNVR